MKRGESHPDWSLTVPNSPAFWAFSLSLSNPRPTLSLPFPLRPVPIAVPYLSCDYRQVGAAWRDVESVMEREVKVDVWGRQITISVCQRSSVYLGKALEVKRPTQGAAVKGWVDAASYKGN